MRTRDIDPEDNPTFVVYTRSRPPGAKAERTSATHYATSLVEARELMELCKELPGIQAVWIELKLALLLESWAP